MSPQRSQFGMLLDRGLTLEQLELALDVSKVDPDPSTNRRHLTVALRDLVSEQEAAGKTKKCLTRVWLNPPSTAAPMIEWVRSQPNTTQHKGLLHFGALLATYPFVGVVARIIGQHLQIEGAVDTSVVRDETRRVVGDRPSVDVAARKSYTTLRNLGVLSQEKQTLRGAHSHAEAPKALGGWLVHAVIATRQADALPMTSALASPELLGLNIIPSSVAAYPLLESHSGASGDVLVPRRMPARYSDELSDPRLF